MFKVTAIKAAVKTAGRYNIFTNGTYSFSLSESQLVSSGVRVGKEYTEAEIEALKHESVYGKAYARALEYIMRRPRSLKEMHDYARRKQWEPAIAERVMQRLVERGYLDDAKFADSWVRHRSLGKPISERKLRLELKQKGVSEELVQQALVQSDEFNESDALKRLVAKKRSRYDDPQKLIAYLARQGFRFDDIKNALNEQP